LTSKHWMLPALALLSIGAPAEAGVIRGTLHVPSVTAPAPAANAYPGRASALPGMHMVVHGLVGDAVLSIERIPADAESTLASSASRPRLAQKDQSFVPRVVPVAVRGVVDFPNMDPIYHNVFSLSPLRRFDLGKYPQGQSKSVTFPRTGVINVYCDIHSSMEAFIVVLPNHAFTQPHAAGDFAFPDLPAGHYSVKVWHPDLGLLNRDVDVPEQGDATLDLSY